MHLLGKNLVRTVIAQAATLVHLLPRQLSRGAQDEIPPLTTADGEETIPEVPLEFVFLFLPSLLSAAGYILRSLKPDEASADGWKV